MNSARISKNEVKHNLINLSQLVFEVTDDYNLNCYYCAYGDKEEHGYRIDKAGCNSYFYEKS